MRTQCEVTVKKAVGSPMGFFERYLTAWVFLCIIAGITLGHFLRGLFPEWLPAEQIDSYIAGLIILAAAPCTAMVFVWSNLS
jgi:ACR3 family arsenite efflux pump ArsB